MAWNTQTSYTSGYAPTPADFNGIGNDLRTHGGDVNVNGFKLSGIGSWTATSQPRAIAGQTSARSITSASWQTVPMDIDIVTPIGITRSGGLLTAPVTGWYLASGACGVTIAGATAVSLCYISNGTPATVYSSKFTVSTDAILLAPTVLLYLPAGTTIGLGIYQGSASPIFTIAASTNLTLVQLF